MEWRDDGSTKGILESLEQRTRGYLAIAKDQYFVDFLQKMLGRIQVQKHQAELLNEELDRSYAQYVNRMKLAGVEVEDAQAAQAAPKAEVQTIETNIQTDRKDSEAEEQVEQPRYVATQAVETQATVISPSVNTNKTKSNTEFMIGTIILSIVGGAFILTALVMLGMYFMNGFVKGMCIYAVAALVLLLSELLLYKRWPKLGMTFTAISIGGLYLSTALNYLTFGNFNMWVALVLTLIITVMVVLLSWKRDSIFYRSLGLITCYLCFLIIQKGSTLQEIAVLAVIVLGINLCCIIVPIQTHKTGFRILHMYLNGIYAFIINVRIYDMADIPEATLIFAGCAMLVTQVLYMVQIVYQQRAALTDKKVGGDGIIAAYFVSGILIYLSVPEIVLRIDAGCSALLHYGCLGVIILLTLAAVLLIHKGLEKWYPYVLLLIIAFNFCCMRGQIWESIIALTVMLIVTKLLSFTRHMILRVSDLVLTTFTCVMCLFLSQDNEIYEIILVMAVLISILFISYWQTYYEIILTFTLAFYSVLKLPDMLKLPVFVGILFVGLLVFHNVKRWQGKDIVIYNTFVLVAETISFLLLMSPNYRNAYVVYLCMLVFGVATIVLTFQEKYHMDFKYKNIILAIFLTYMALIVRTNLPIINSILMMLIALICVGWGFSIKEKEIRIYGLVLSLIVCGKIVLYDFFDAEALQKTILFFVVGVIALMIAGIYIVLERKANIQLTSDGEKQ